MSDILEKLNVSPMDIVGANKIAGSANASPDSVDSGVPFDSHLQAATASQKLTETHTAESQGLPGSAAVSRSPSEGTQVSETDTAPSEVLEEKLPADLIVHKNRVALASPQAESGGSRLPEHLNSSDKSVGDSESVVDREQTINREQRVAALDSNLIVSEQGDSQLNPELDTTGHEVVAGNAERILADGQNADEETVDAQNFASVELNSESDSLAPSVSLSTAETEGALPIQASSNSATSGSVDEASIDAPVLPASPVIPGSIGNSQSVDSPQQVVNTQNKTSASFKSDNPVALPTVENLSSTQNLQTGTPQSAPLASQPASLISQATANPASAWLQPLQTGEIASSVKNAQPVTTIDALNDLQVTNSAQARGTSMDAGVDVNKSNVVTPLTVQTAGASPVQSVSEVDESLVQNSVPPLTSAALSRAEPEASFNKDGLTKDGRIQATAEPVISSNLTTTVKTDALGVTAALQISSIDGDSGAGNHSSNMFLAASNGIVAAPNPARMTAGSSLVLAPTVMQMSPDIQDQALVGNVRWMVNEGISNATINVSPGGMGPISVQLTMEGEKMSVSFFAGQAATREALDMAAPRLRDHLQSQGLDQVRVEVSDSRSDNSRNMQQSQTGEKQSSDTRHTREVESLIDENTDTASVDTRFLPLQSKSSLIDAFA